MLESICRSLMKNHSTIQIVRQKSELWSQAKKSKSQYPVQPANKQEGNPKGNNSEKQAIIQTRSKQNKSMERK